MRSLWRSAAASGWGRPGASPRPAQQVRLATAMAIPPATPASLSVGRATRSARLLQARWTGLRTCVRSPPGSDCWRLCWDAYDLPERVDALQAAYMNDDDLKAGDRSALTQAERTRPCTLVIFGATGDL